MKEIHIFFIGENGAECKAVPIDATILDAFLLHGVTGVSAACGGKGTCKKCLVKVEGLGEVLACQTRVTEGMKIFLPKEEKSFILESGNRLTPDAASEIPKETSGKENEFKAETRAKHQTYGIACDLGTTTVVCHLLDLSNGRKVQTVSEKNRQELFGGDVISRITASMEGHLEQEHGIIIKQLNEMIEKLCQMQHVNQEQIVTMAVAGNTVMCHLFMNLSPEAIGKAPFLPEEYFGKECSTREAGLQLSGTLYVAPAVSGYVGGDITAGVLYTKMYQAEEKMLLLDVGTNGEMVLGDKHGLLCCAAAAGPAFEGAAIHCGMMAQTGAIGSVKIGGIKKAPQIISSVLGGGEAQGICGSGLIDALAVFLMLHIVDETGCFVEKRELPASLQECMEDLQGESCFRLSRNVVITQRDIRQLQMAKAAIRAGIQALLETSHTKACEVQKLLLAGGFGSYIHIQNAAIIGLIPKELVSVGYSAGNTAGEGAVLLTVSDDAKKDVFMIKEKMEYLELSTDPNFTDYYMNEMFFEESE